MIDKIDRVIDKISDSGPTKGLYNRLTKFRNKIADAEMGLKSGSITQKDFNRELIQITYDLKGLSNKHPEFNELVFFQTFKPKKPGYNRAGKLSETEIKKMIKSQKVAPDMVDKGVHFNVGEIELKIIINGDSLDLVQVFSSSKPDKVKAAVKKVS